MAGKYSDDCMKVNPPLTTSQKTWGVIIMLALAAFYAFCDPFEPVYPTQVIRDEYDYVIVGGGTGGSVVAHRLAELTNTSILVIEAGKYDFDHSIRIPVASVSLLDTDKNLVWNYKTVPQEHSAKGFQNNRMTLPLGKVLGGSSSIGDMIYGRGNPADYTSWGPQWSWDSLLPFFLKSERAVDIDSSSFHSSHGQVPVSRGDGDCELSATFANAARELGHKQVDYTSPDQIGFSQNLFTMQDGERWSAARAFLEPAINRRYKVHVTTGSVASKVLFSGNRATQVVFNQDGVSKAVRAKKEIILTGGAIETPKLLMLSGVGPSAELNKHKIPVVADLPVGRGLRDPVKLWLRYTTDKAVSVTRDKLTSARSFLDYYLLKSGTWAETLLSQTTLFMNTAGAAPQPDLNINMLRAVALPNQAEILGVKYEQEDLFNAGLYDSNTEGYTFVPTLLHPQSEGKVSLRSTGIHDPPLIDPQYLSAEQDVETLLTAIRYIEKLAGSSSFSHLAASPVAYPAGTHKPGTDEYWRHVIRHFAFTAAHPSGTCAIGEVVDEELAVKGLEGLRVVDSSVFPTTVSGDSTGVLYGVAEKIAALIKSQHT